MPHPTMTPQSIFLQSNIWSSSPPAQLPPALPRLWVLNPKISKNIQVSKLLQRIAVQHSSAPKIAAAPNPKWKSVPGWGQTHRQCLLEVKVTSMPQYTLRGIYGMQHDRVPGRHQAQFPGVSSSCMSCAYLLRDSDCSLLPAIAASSFAGGGKEQRYRHFTAYIRDWWWLESPRDWNPASHVQWGNGKKSNSPCQSLVAPLQS